MENFDEFEFKPITEGLGFHKKQNLNKEAAGISSHTHRQDARMQESKFHKVEDAKSALASERVSINTQSKPVGSGLNRKKSQATLEYAFENNNFEEEVSVTPSSQKRSIAATLPSIFFDGIVITGLAGLFLFATFIVAEIDSVKFFSLIPSDTMTTLALLVLVFSILESYLIVSRSFFGSTLGEWAFEVELGTKEEQKRLTYPLRVFFRSLITLISGLIFLPILSVIVGWDIGGKLSGVSLHRG